ncbi:putative Uridine/cytidine kinase [Ascobolus immersus RN42]|uniref:Putative Uridine/cytidine kinase n=1 Tax=Ascobolus immersus RN42 TaxID=1160509 RepID=A0A3N4IRX9_ASCIM|nr:putative Uridine/cytidine kinase [Ascobolus immersus RN42]
MSDPLPPITATTYVDKTPQILPFLKEVLKTHFHPTIPASDAALETHTTPIPPLVVGLSGIQGSGKTTLVDALASALRSTPHPTIPNQYLRVTTFSLDDFYLPHADQVKLAQSNPENPLIQVRGQPGTHDVPLLLQTLSALKTHDAGEVKIPKYDKSLFDGAGDRLPESEWSVVETPVDVVLFEGWCVGFRAFEEDSDVVMRWADSQMMGGHAGKNKLVDVRWINERLKGYGEVTDQLDALIHIDAEQLEYVYEWRLEQEHKLVKDKGTGMSDEAVKKFIDCYMPTYEVYLDGLREGAFKNATGNGKQQLRVILGRDRGIKKMELYEQEE